jgi:hypothetical protein
MDDDFIIEDEEESVELSNDKTFRAPTLAFTTATTSDDPYAFDLDQTEANTQDEADGDDDVLVDGDDSTGSFGLSPFRASRGSSGGLVFTNTNTNTNGVRHGINNYSKNTRSGQTHHDSTALRQSSRRDIAIDSDASSASIEISDSFQESSDISLSTSDIISSAKKTKKPTLADAKAAAVSRLQTRQTITSPISPPISSSKSVRTPNRGTILSASSRQPIHVESDIDSSSGGVTTRAFGKVVMGIDALGELTSPLVSEKSELTTDKSQILNEFRTRYEERRDDVSVDDEVQEESMSRSNADDYALGATLAVLAQGARIQARYGAGPEWYSGTIVANNEDGTYSVSYDDGDYEEAVPRHRIRDELVTTTEKGKVSLSNSNSTSASIMSPRPQISIPTVPTSAKSDERHGRVIMFSEALHENSRHSYPIQNLNHVDENIVDEVLSSPVVIETPLNVNSKISMNDLHSRQSGFSIADTEYSSENFEADEKATQINKSVKHSTTNAIPAGASPVIGKFLKQKDEVSVQTDETIFAPYPQYHSGYSMHSGYYAPPLFPPLPPPPPPPPLIQPLGLGTSALSALLSSLRSGSISAPSIPSSVPQPIVNPTNSSSSIYLKTLASSLALGNDSATSASSTSKIHLDISPSAAASAAGMHPSIVSALSNYQSVLAASDANFSRQLELLKCHAARSRASLTVASGYATVATSSSAPPLAGSPSSIARNSQSSIPYSYSSLEETKRMLASRRVENSLSIDEARRRVRLGEI